MLDSTLEDFADKAVSKASDIGCQYCDVRAEIIKKEGFVLENNEIQHSTTKSDQGLGIRLLNDGAWAFFSISNPKTMQEITVGIEEAAKTSLYYSTKKKNKVRIGNIPTIKDKVTMPVQKIPDFDELIKIGFECDKIIHEEKRIIKSIVSMGFSNTAKYFVNSEGTKIKQNFTDTIGDLVAVAYESGLTQSINITEGGRGGIEKLLNVNKESGNNDIIQSAKDISQKAARLIDAKPVKENKGVVIMNPDFVALLTHEILGHPSEADRVLGREMAWAGGAWWADKLGEQIGSKELSVFDDPTIEGSLGNYKYDDEGVRASRTELIENGRLTHHMQSRETSEIFGVKPNSNMRATSYKFMPLIRMACTCIDKGNWSPSEMISEVKDGYLVSNMKIPSIDMKRYNWSISCQYAHKIENGQIGELLRDVIVLGTAPEFFKSIDACGNDFTIRPITNCGKGDPMQSMVMGNGGPSIRGIATVKSVGTLEI